MCPIGKEELSSTIKNHVIIVYVEYQLFLRNIRNLGNSLVQVVLISRSNNSYLSSVICAQMYASLLVVV